MTPNFFRIVAAQLADGWIARAAAPAAFATGAELARQAWRAADRPGSPRLTAVGVFALGPNAREEAGRVLLDYYAYAGEHAERIAASALVTVDAIRESTAAFDSAGCDEVVLFPAVPDPNQVDLLADAIRR